VVINVKITRTITVDHELWKKLKEYALKNNMTISKCVEIAIKRLIENE